MLNRFCLLSKRTPTPYRVFDKSLYVGTYVAMYVEKLLEVQKYFADL